MKGTFPPPGAVDRRRNLVVGALFIAVVAAAWFAGTWSTTSAREADFERFAQLSASHAFGMAVGWWFVFAGTTWRFELLVAATQVACCVAVVYAAWRLSRSLVVAVAAGILTVGSPFPESWLARPAGAADALTSLGVLTACAAVLDPALARRKRAIVGAAAALLAVTFSGWAAIPLFVAAAVTPAAVPALAGVAVALALRAGAGLPPGALAGRWDASIAVVAMRSLVALAVATPAALFVGSRQRAVIGRARRLSRAEAAVAAAAFSLVAASAFLVHAAPALFCAQLALTLAGASVAGRAGFRPALHPPLAALAAVAAFAAAFVVRPEPIPADDVASYLGDRTAARAAGPKFVVVDHGDPAVRARYSPEHLAYLAERPVSVTYVERAPAQLTGPTLTASAAGLFPIVPTPTPAPPVAAKTPAPAVSLSPAARAAVGPSRTWVSSTGKDGNPCSRTAPCRTFARAVAKTAAGGEVEAIDPGEFGTVTITKEITIDGGGGNTGVVLAARANGFDVNAGADDVVTLRNLRIIGLRQGGTPAPMGIKFNSGAALNVEHCVIQGFANIGIDFEPAVAANLSVVDSSVHSAAAGGLVAATNSGVNRVSIHRSSFVNNGVFGIKAGTNTRMSIVNSLIANTGRNGASGDGLVAIGAAITSEGNVVTGSAGNGTRSMGGAIIWLSNTSITNNLIAGIVSDPGARTISVMNNTIANNGPAGLDNGEPSATATPRPP